MGFSTESGFFIVPTMDEPGKELQRKQPWKVTKVELQPRRLRCMHVAVHQCPQLRVLPKTHLGQNGEVYIGNSKRMTRGERRPAQKAARRQPLPAPPFPHTLLNLILFPVSLPDSNASISATVQSTPAQAFQPHNFAARRDTPPERQILCLKVSWGSTALVHQTPRLEIS